MSGPLFAPSRRILRALDAVAARRGIGRAGALTRAVGMLSYLDAMSGTHDVVLRDRRDGSERQLLLDGAPGTCVH